jgi:nucleotide-binding universal stress UspA family protein
MDFSELAEREFQMAVHVCEALGARLVLHHNVSAVSAAFSKAWEWDQSHQRDEPTAADAERRLETLMKRLPRGVTAEAALTHGPLAAVLLALAEKLPADLLVLGTHGWSNEDHASITERIIEQTPCPVLTIRDSGAARAFRLTSEPGLPGPRVVVPTDFSPSGTRAVEFAIDVARQLPIDLHLVHISPTPDIDPALGTLVNLVPPELKSRTQCHVRVGTTLDELDTLLGELRPELIVMGTHARGFWRRLFTRDNARQVLHAANCPVCFVPPTTPPGLQDRHGPTDACG